MQRAENCERPVRAEDVAIPVGRVTDPRQQIGVGRGIWYSLMGNAFAPLAALATAPMLAQALGVFGRGELAAATAPLLLATAIGAFGLPEAIIYVSSRYVRKTRSAVVRASLLTAFLGIGSAVAVYLSAGVLSANNPNLEALIRLTALAVVPALMSAIPRALAAGFGNWKLLAIERALFGFLRLVVIGGLWMTQTLNPLSATIATLLLPLVSASALLPSTLSAMRTIGKGEKAKLSTVLGYGFRVWLGALSGIILTRISQVVMVPLSNEHQLGLYAIAVTIGELPLVVSGAFRDVVFSADASSSDDARLQQAARMATMTTFMVSAALGSTVAAWLPLLFGTGFQDAVPLALTMLTATVVGATGSVAGAGLSARGRPGLRSWAMGVGAIVNLAILLATVPTLGAVGAVWAALVGNLVAGTGNIIFLKVRFGLGFWGFFGFRTEDVARSKSMVTHLLARFEGKDEDGKKRHRRKTARGR